MNMTASIFQISEPTKWHMIIKSCIK